MITRESLLCCLLEQKVLGTSDICLLQASFFGCKSWIRLTAYTSFFDLSTLNCMVLLSSFREEKAVPGRPVPAVAQTKTRGSARQRAAVAEGTGWGWCGLSLHQQPTARHLRQPGGVPQGVERRLLRPTAWGVLEGTSRAVSGALSVVLRWGLRQQLTPQGLVVVKKPAMVVCACDSAMHWNALRRKCPD